MYYVARIRKMLKIPPNMIFEDRSIKEIALELLRKDFVEGLEGRNDEDLGIILAVDNLEVLSKGIIIPGDPRLYVEVEFDALTYKPVPNEVVKGRVVDVKNFGLFVNIGPVEGLVHKTQIMDEPVKFDPSRGAFIGVKSNRIIELGDIVRARVAQVSTKGGWLKVGLTMRQPFLGKEEWIESEREKVSS
ncbi:MAG: DNA-directed RNA polymerase [Desulfurococcales archaeon]|nr:DNA-directed RNA polymerase [Desulfurococcales archaeon]